MNAKVFVDTNVLVYARDTADLKKHQQARAWLEELWQKRRGLLSFQVLHEYYVTVTRKLDPGLSPGEARSDIRSLLAWNPLPADQPLLETAWRIEDTFKVSWWDSLIIAAAQVAQARFLLTEDLQAGMDFEGVKVVNPFQVIYADLDN
jgi:predicted nucleic acid-binding protein